MPGAGREGWYQDPANRHEYRWFSDGTPTDLVMDSGVTSRDALSMTEPGLYQSMELQQPPDDGPLLHTQNDAKPQFELLNFGVGPVAVVNTAARADDRTSLQMERPGTVEILAVFVPLLAGLYLLTTAPVGLALGVMLLSAVVAFLGRQRRARRARRFQRPTTRT
jgi:hypothetical protein